MANETTLIAEFKVMNHDWRKLILSVAVINSRTLEMIHFRNVKVQVENSAQSTHFGTQGCSPSDGLVEIID